jgi:hypothetical protein
MKEQFPWLDALEALAKLTTAVGLFAFLLHRGGLRAAAVTLVTLANLAALFCVLPAPGEFVLAATITFGTCSYAVLLVEWPWMRVAIVAVCLLTFDALVAQASGVLALFVVIPLALWIGFLVVVRDWARAAPKNAPELIDGPGRHSQKEPGNTI